MVTSEQEARKVIVVIPAYNEETTVQETIRGVQELRPTMAKEALELLVYVVDDGSTDATRRLAVEAGADRVLRHRVNRGLGAAIRTGLLAACTDGAAIAIKMDADLQHDPMDIPALIQPILEDEADLVYGCRFERIEYKMPFVRRTGNVVFTRLMRWLTGWPLKDSQPGILAAGRAYLERLHLPGDYNYTQQILLDAYHNGMRFIHVPVGFRERTEGKSFVSLKYPFKVLPQVLMVIVGLKPLKIFGPLGLLFLGLGAAIFAWEIGQWSLGEAEKPVQHVNATLGLLLFGLQTLFFGILAELIVRNQRR